MDGFLVASLFGAFALVAIVFAFVYFEILSNRPDPPIDVSGSWRPALAARLGVQANYMSVEMPVWVEGVTVEVRHHAGTFDVSGVCANRDVIAHLDRDDVRTHGAGWRALPETLRRDVERFARAGGTSHAGSPRRPCAPALRRSPGRRWSRHLFGATWHGVIEIY